MLRKIKVEDGIWKQEGKTKPYLVDIRPWGRDGNRLRQNFATLGEARRYKTFQLAEALERKPWEQQKLDKRRLSEFIDLWHEIHGQSLADIDRRLAKLKNICKAMKNPLVAKMTSQDWTNYRSKRLKQVSIKTVNNEQAYLNALFNELIRANEIYVNPIANVRQLKYKQAEMGFLEKNQIPLLLDELKKSKNKDALIVAKIALSIGARWGEIESLHSRNVLGNNITITNTKGGKNRTIPISNELLDEIPKKTGLLFSSCIGAFRSALKRTGIELPKGQCSHVLRHTFASHFMMSGGNILVLQQILGHASIKDTMKYAHFSPTHFEEAVKLSPLNNSRV